jgi:hypothetical protein
MGHSSSKPQPHASTYTYYPPTGTQYYHPSHQHYHRANAPEHFHQAAGHQHCGYQHETHQQPAADVHGPGDKWKVKHCSHNDPTCVGDFFNQAGQVYKMVHPSELDRYQSTLGARSHDIAAPQITIQQGPIRSSNEDQSPPLVSEPAPAPRKHQSSTPVCGPRRAVTPSKRVSFHEPMAQVNSPGLVPNMGYGPAFVPQQDDYHLKYDRLPDHLRP